MKKLTLLLVIAIMCVATVAMAARVTTVPIVHEADLVYQAYCGQTCEGAGNVSFKGYGGTGDDVISSVPGILSICPGVKWSNFIGAVIDQDLDKDGQIDVPKANCDYTIKNIVLKKYIPQIVQCYDIFGPARTIPQQGTPNIRLWWPLMYEVPGTCWELTITYGTPCLYDDDGPGPNPPGYVHQEVWKWCVDATLQSMKDELELFHELPYGLDEVPLVSDEVLYPVLQAKLDDIITAVEQGDLVTAGDILADFELEVMDACIYESPRWPAPTGLGTGIANSTENPACCKLMADAEYVGKALNILQPSK